MTGTCCLRFQAQVSPSPVSYRFEGRDRYSEGMPIVTSAQQIRTPDKEKLRAFVRGLDSSIKYAIRNLNPKSYEEALALAQNKELELNGGKPKQLLGRRQEPSRQGPNRKR